ncbi:MAG: hypothetical protein V4764_04460 [Burkholderia sp.]
MRTSDCIDNEGGAPPRSRKNAMNPTPDHVLNPFRMAGSRAAKRAAVPIAAGSAVPAR